MIKTQIKDLALKVFGQNRFKRFIVLSRGRSGSSMLKSYLNSHPNIKCQEELFNRLDGKNYKEILNGAFSKQRPGIKALGFKLFYYHPGDESTGIWNAHEGLWKHLIDLQDLYIVHLRRRNLLRIALSATKAHTSDVWGTTKKQEIQKIPRVVLDANELRQKFMDNEKFHKLGNNLFNHHPVLNVDYENLVANLETEFRKITSFFDLPYYHPKTPLKKQSRGTLKETIENYDELQATFKGTEWNIYSENEIANLKNLRA